jgi:hypothetical protein
MSEYIGIPDLGYPPGGIGTNGHRLREGAWVDSLLGFCSDSHRLE